MFNKKADVKKLEELEEKYNKLYELYLQQKQQIQDHESMLIKSAKLFKAIDATIVPICEHYRKEFEKQQREEVDRYIK